MQRSNRRSGKETRQAPREHPKVTTKTATTIPSGDGGCRHEMKFHYDKDSKHITENGTFY